MSAFDVDGFKSAVEVVFTAQEILVGNADYPTESIAATSRRFRQLGLGYANLGALLMALGLAYDSDAGRAWAVLAVKETSVQPQTRRRFSSSTAPGQVPCRVFMNHPRSGGMDAGASGWTGAGSTVAGWG